MDHGQHALPHLWNGLYIALSYAIATFASYVSLELAGRAGPRPGTGGGRVWLAAQALVLGYGIWAMHFIGMLAFQVPTEISYNIPLTILSGLVAVVLVYPALVLLHGGPLRVPRLALAGLVAGSGIVVMHYLGMAAFRVPGTAVALVWGPFLVSVLIAVGASMAALFLFKQAVSAWAEGLSTAALIALKVAAGLVMGAAIVSMHYTGMAALRYDVTDAAVLGGSAGADTTLLASAVTVVSFLLLGVAITTLLVDDGKPVQAV